MPQSLPELIAYLTEHPRVHFYFPDGSTHLRMFDRLDTQGRIWWKWECGQRSFTPTREDIPVTIDFRPDGFTVTAYTVMRYDYLPD